MNYNPFSLASKIVLVTGASSGIGRATAIECSKLGAKVIVTGRNSKRLRMTFDQLEGDGHQLILADLTSDGELSNLVAKCPVVDCLALCAGMSKTLPFTLCSKVTCSEIFDVNFTAPMELLRLLLKGLKIATAGSVVFVSSVAGLPGGVAAGNAAYGAAKAAVIAAMRHFVREFSTRQIRFNAITPGMVNTPSVEQFQKKLTDAQIDADIARYPLGRYGEPSDIAHGIAYLLSDASSWVTGQQLVIDGGLTV